MRSGAPGNARAVDQIIKNSVQQALSYCNEAVRLLLTLRHSTAAV